MSIEFARPERHMRGEVLAFRDAFYAAGEKTINGGAGLDFYDDYETWIQYLQDIEAGRTEGLVPSRVWLARDDDTGRIVGILDIRPNLPPATAHYGHIGYSVLPGRRGRGVATQMVRWGVEQLRAAGVGDIFASVYADNGPSLKVLEKCGFLQKGLYKEEGTGKEIIQYINSPQEKEREDHD